jgi:hypothetical protein
MTEVRLTSGSHEILLPTEPDDALRALVDALATPVEHRRDAVSAVVARWPTFLDAWASLAALARDDVEAYAAARVGYHRGLDRLRQNGWRGTAFVPGRHEPNRGFLRSLTALVVAAEAIGERDEAERCRLFVRQLDPAWPLPA